MTPRPCWAALPSSAAAADSPAASVQRCPSRHPSLTLCFTLAPHHWLPLSSSAGSAAGKVMGEGAGPPGSPRAAGVPGPVLPSAEGAEMQVGVERPMSRRLHLHSLSRLCCWFGATLQSVPCLPAALPSFLPCRRARSWVPEASWIHPSRHSGCTLLRRGRCRCALGTSWRQQRQGTACRQRWRCDAAGACT